MPRQPTAAQIAASRRNGALSRGPKSAAGKAISARNATVHSLTSVQTTFPPVDPTFLQTHLIALAPCNAYETQLVREMAEARWRARLCGALEIEVHKRYYPPDSTNPAAAYMARPAAFATVWVTEARYQRTYERLRRELTASRLNSNSRALHVLEHEPQTGPSTLTQDLGRRAQTAPISSEKHENEPDQCSISATTVLGRRTQAAPAPSDSHDNQPEPGKNAATPDLGCRPQAATASGKKRGNEPEPNPAAVKPDLGGRTLTAAAGSRTRKRTRPVSISATTALGCWTQAAPASSANHDDQPEPSPIAATRDLGCRPQAATASGGKRGNEPEPDLTAVKSDLGGRTQTAAAGQERENEPDRCSISATTVLGRRTQAAPSSSDSHDDQLGPGRPPQPESSAAERMPPPRLVKNAETNPSPARRPKPQS